MAIQTPQYLENKGYSARFDRQILSELVRPGVVSAASMLVTATSGMTVSIAKGGGYVAGTINVDQGTYRIFNDAAILRTHDAAHATLPRIDMIVAVVYDSTELGSGTDGGDVIIVKGTPSAGATLANRTGAVPDASLPPNWMILADVLIPAASISVLTANIRDYRPYGIQKADFGDYGFSPLATPPVGFALADARLVKRRLYQNLFNAIGTTYNIGGEASDEFRFPSIEGRVLVGKGQHADVDALTDNDAVAVANRTPKHNSSVVDAGHSHTPIAPATAFRTYGTGSTGPAESGPTGTTQGSTATATTGISVGPGSTRPIDMPAYQVGLPLIFTGTAYAA